MFLCSQENQAIILYWCSMFLLFCGCNGKIEWGHFRLDFLFLSKKGEIHGFELFFTDAMRVSYGKS